MSPQQDEYKDTENAFHLRQIRHQKLSSSRTLSRIRVRVKETIRRRVIRHSHIRGKV